MSRSIGTISPAWSSRIARSARCFGGPRSATAPFADTSSAPRSRKSITSAATGGIPPLPIAGSRRGDDACPRSIGALRRGDLGSLARRPGDSMASRQSRPLGGKRHGGRGSDPRPPGCCLPRATVRSGSSRRSPEAQSADRRANRADSRWSGSRRAHRRRRGSTGAIGWPGPLRMSSRAHHGQELAVGRTMLVPQSKCRDQIVLSGVARERDVDGLRQRREADDSRCASAKSSTVARRDVRGTRPRDKGRCRDPRPGRWSCPSGAIRCPSLLRRRNGECELTVALGPPHAGDS